MLIEIPELAVVVIIGESTHSKFDFIHKYFSDEEIIDELSSKKSEEHLNKRLEKALLTAINLVSFEHKKHDSILKSAKKYHCVPIAIVCNTDDSYHIKNKPGSHKDFNEYLKKKGFKEIFLLDSEAVIAEAEVKRSKLANNKKDIQGPFDIIGDIHGCYDELCELLVKLDYRVDKEKAEAYSIQHRKVIFLGDLVDRGPQITKVLRLVMFMVKSGNGYCVLGNHDGKLLRKLQGAKVKIAHGLEETLIELRQEPSQFRKEVEVFLETLVSHYVFDHGRLVVVHAGLKEHLHGRESAKVRDLAMYGETTGEIDEYGFPVRINWSSKYKGDALVVYGHTPQLSARMINHTINIDTGCVYGGKLTAFRYPEEELVAVKARKVYYASPKPLA